MREKNEKRSLILKRIAIAAAAFIAFNIIASYAATVIVCSVIFERFDIAYDLPEEITDARELMTFERSGRVLQGYYYRSENSDTLIVIAPGFHAGADGYAHLAMSLLDSGYSVFSFDPTGCNMSEGDTSGGFPGELLDLAAALGFIDEKDSFGNEKVALIGHSMGGYAAACVSEFGYSASAIITVSGVNSAMEGMIGSSYNSIGAFAYTNYVNLYLYEAFGYGVKAASVRADKAVENSGIPTLVIHGSDDPDYPADRFSIYSHRSDIAAESVSFALVDGGHTDILIDDNGSVVSSTYELITDFLERSIE